MSSEVVTNPPSLRERVGGRWAVSWLGYLFWYPLSVLFIFATLPELQYVNQIIPGIVISTVAYLATGAVMWLSSVTVLRNRKVTAAPIAVVVITGGLAWSARSLVLGLAINMSDQETATPIIARLLYGFALGAIIVPITSHLLDSISRFKTTRNQLITEQVNESIAVTREDALSQALRLGLLQQVQGAIRSARVDLDRLDLSSNSIPVEAIAALELVSDQGIRQVSHQTWSQAHRLSRIRLSEVVDQAAARGFYRLPYLPIGLIFLLVPLARFLEPHDMLPMLGIALYAVAIAAVANRVIRKSDRNRYLYIGVSIFLLALSGAFSQLSIAGTNISIPVAVLISVMSAIVFPILSVTSAWQPASREALERLRLALNQSDLQLANATEREQRIRQEIAVMLHGSIGANFTATTMRLRHAIDSGNVDMAREALQEARRLTDVDLTTWSPIQSRNLDEALHAVIDPWIGVVDISSTIDPNIECSVTEIQSIVDLVTEGITNAVRHGQASVIDIHVSEIDHHIDIQVISNGSLTSIQPAGLGSRLLDQVSNGRWELSASSTGTGTKLRVMLTRSA